MRKFLPMFIPAKFVSYCQVVFWSAINFLPFYLWKYPSFFVNIRGETSQCQKPPYFKIFPSATCLHIVWSTCTISCAMQCTHVYHEWSFFQSTWQHWAPVLYASSTSWSNLCLKLLYDYWLLMKINSRIPPVIILHTKWIYQTMLCNVAAQLAYLYLKLL